MGLGLQGAFGNLGGQDALAKIMIQRKLEAQQAFENQRQMHGDARADRQVSNQEAALKAASERQASLDKETQQQHAYTEANTLADQIPPGQFLGPLDPAVGRLQTGGRGSLLQTQESRPAIETGPLLPGDTGAAKQQGFIKTASQKQIDTTTDNERQAGAAKALADREAATTTETARHNRAMEARPVGGMTGVGADLTDDGLNMAADQYAQTGNMPSLGMGNAAARSAIINRAAQRHPNTSIAESQAGFGADKGSLASVQKMRDAVGAFEQTASKNGDVMLASAKKLTDTGSPWLNKPWRAVEGQAQGDPNVSAFAAARRTVVAEYARIVSNPNLAGTLSDSARNEMDAVLSGDATIPQIVAVLGVLKQDAANRRSALDETLTGIHGRISTGSRGTKQAPANNDPLGIR